MPPVLPLLNTPQGFDGGLALQDCSFTGYDIAVNCDGAYILPTDRNVFTDNGIALYIDAAGRALRHDYKHLVYNNSFLNNETAIYIKSLPDTIDPYDFRITKNDFINNKNDIISEEKSGYQYFFDNYHGVYNGSDEGHTRRAPKYNHSNKYLQVYPTFEESVADLDDTDALPARKVTGQVKNMALPLEGSTMSMSIDTASLQEDRTEDLIIEMMNDEDEMQAAWTIPAQQTATFANMRLMRMSASAEAVC